MTNAFRGSSDESWRATRFERFRSWVGQGAETAVGQLADSSSVDVLVTVDRSLAKQQNLKKHRVAVVLLKAKTNAIDDLKPLIPSLQAALPSLQPGHYLEIG